MKNTAYLDIETKSSSGKLLSIGLIYQDYFYHFLTWDELIRFLKTNRKIRYIWAHNGGGFDYLSLLDWIKDKGYRIDIILSGSRAIGMDISMRREKGSRAKIRLRDSLCIFPVSLDKLAESFNIRGKVKLKRLPEYYWKRNRKLYLQYLEQDCRILQQVMERFHELMVKLSGKDKWRIRATIASNAIALWKVLEKKRVMRSMNKRLVEFMRKSYRGGRCEAFRPGLYEEISCYDVNSMYPYIMKSIKVPKSYRGAWTKRYRGNGIYQVRFKQREGKYPVLQDHETGEYRREGTGVYTSIELDYFRQFGSIEVIEGYRFIDMDYLFISYVDKLYSEKVISERDGNSAMRLVTKLLLNALYGKFGQKDKGYKIVGGIKPETKRKWLKERLEFYDYGNFCIVATERSVAYSHPVISSFITAGARVHLHKLVERYDALYCDTDSIYTLSGDVETGSELGMLKHEGTGMGVIISKKLKYFNGEFTVKGIPEAELRLTLEDMVSLLHGNKIKIEYSTPSTIREVVQKGYDPCRWYERERTIKMT